MSDPIKLTTAASSAPSLESDSVQSDLKRPEEETQKDKDTKQSSKTMRFSVDLHGGGIIRDPVSLQSCQNDASADKCQKIDNSGYLSVSEYGGGVTGGKANISFIGGVVSKKGRRFGIGPTLLFGGDYAKLSSIKNITDYPLETNLDCSMIVLRDGYAGMGLGFYVGLVSLTLAPLLGHTAVQGKNVYDGSQYEPSSMEFSQWHLGGNGQLSFDLTPHFSLGFYAQYNGENLFRPAERVSRPDSDLEKLVALNPQWHTGVNFSFVIENPLSREERLLKRTRGIEAKERALDQEKKLLEQKAALKQRENDLEKSK